MKRKFSIGGEPHEVLLPPGKAAPKLRPIGHGEFRFERDGAVEGMWIAVCGDTTYIHLNGRSWVLAAVDELAEAAAAGGAGADTAEAPMPGTVVRVLVDRGDVVKRGQALLVIESMKMETIIVAWRDGVVAAIHRPLGATFDRKAPLVSLEPKES